MQTAKAIIIGAGVAGIASAIRLALKGFDVKVFEANSYPGGKLSELQFEGFRFDAGPSLFTMPQYVDELFALAKKNPRDYFNYQQLDLVCRYLYEDRTLFDAFADEEKLAREFEIKTTDTAESIKKFLKKSREIYDITDHIFLQKSLHKISSYINVKTLSSLLHFLKIDPFRSMNKANKGFFRDSKTIEYFNRYATYNGSNPYQAPATLNVIPHLEHFYGAFFPVKGMYSIVLSLVKLAEELGVKFTYNTKVAEIKLDGKTVTGITTEQGEFVTGNILISNMDVYFTYTKLLRSRVSPAKVIRQERSSSALIFYWGIKKKFKQLKLHNIFFSKNYCEEFDFIWKRKSIYNDPTVYINISSKLKEDDAPNDSENWFVMINVPPNVGQDWDELIQHARRNILEKLSRVLETPVEDYLVFEKILDPRDIEDKTSSYQGSLYGTSSNNKYAAFLRHANFSSKIKGLYFAGGSVHPGGGIPLALLSAKIACNLVP